MMTSWQIQPNDLEAEVPAVVGSATQGCRQGPSLSVHSSIHRACSDLSLTSFRAERTCGYLLPHAPAAEGGTLRPQHSRHESLVSVTLL